MHEFLQLTLAQKLSDSQSDSSWTPFDLNLVGRINPFVDPQVVKKINGARLTFNQYFPNGDDRNRDCDAVAMNMTYLKLCQSDNALGEYVRSTFKNATNFVSHYKQIMGLDHIEILS